MRSKHRNVIAMSGATKQTINSNDEKLPHPDQSEIAMINIVKTFWRN